MVPPGRADVDLRGWRKRSLPRRRSTPDTVWSSMFVGPPASQPLSNLRKNSVKMHGVSLAVARRNALELAQQLRRSDDCSCDDWPCFDNVLYLPVPDRVNEDAELRIEGAYCGHSGVGVYQQVVGKRGYRDVNVPLASSRDPLLIDVEDDNGVGVRQRVFLDEYRGAQFAAARDGSPGAAAPSNVAVESAVAGTSGRKRNEPKEDYWDIPNFYPVGMRRAHVAPRTHVLDPTTIDGALPDDHYSGRCTVNIVNHGKRYVYNLPDFRVSTYIPPPRIHTRWRGTVIMI